jgi:predicted acylesterase/phospholipase RssA
MGLRSCARRQYMFRVRVALGAACLALPALLAPVAVRGLRDLLRLVDGGFFDVAAIHHVGPRRKRAARGASGRDVVRSWALGHGDFSSWGSRGRRRGLGEGAVRKQASWAQ